MFTYFQGSGHVLDVSALIWTDSFWYASRANQPPSGLLCISVSEVQYPLLYYQDNLRSVDRHVFLDVRAHTINTIEKPIRIVCFQIDHADSGKLWININIKGE